MGRHDRDPEQLYRGARLAAALDWAKGHDPDLNDSERAFWLPAPSSTSVSCAGLAALRPSWPVCLWSCWSPGRWRWCSARPPGATRSSPPQGPGCPGDRPHGQPVRPGVPAGGGGVPIPELGRNARRPADCPGPERTAHRLSQGFGNDLYAFGLAPTGRRSQLAAVMRLLAVRRPWCRDASHSPIKAHGGLFGLTFSRDGRLLVTAGEDGTARLWNVARAAPVGNPLSIGAVRAAGFSPTTSGFTRSAMAAYGMGGARRDPHRDPQVFPR